MRIEKDKIGELEIEDKVLYGINTKRAVNNFTLGNGHVRMELIYAIVMVKKAAAMAHGSLLLMDKKKADAIVSACDKILAGGYEGSFVTDALQGGAGTSTNMNVNEVVANLALEELGYAHGRYDIINPLDDVNKGQSTNDVYPTALRIASINLVRKLSTECSLLQEALQKKELEFEGVLKIGRTELMDAVPITLGQEFGAYAQAIARDRWRIYKVEERLRQVNIGGTAVGTGGNASRKYVYKVIDILRDITGMGLARAEYPMDLTQNADVFAEVSGLLRALAVNLMKIANDLKLLNSNVFSEIHLMDMQAGSTIMPGKVNPVIPEMVVQVAIKVMALDSAVTISAGSGQLELNACMPLIADSLLESLCLLIRCVRTFRKKCIETLEANEKNCRKHLDNSLAAVTVLSRFIGYDKAAELAAKSKGNPAEIRQLMLAEGLMDEKQIDEILSYKSAFRAYE